MHRQAQPDFVRAIQDALSGRCTPAVVALMRYCVVSDEQYKAPKCTVLHLMARDEDVQKQNAACLEQLCVGGRPPAFIAVDSVQEEKDREMALQAPVLQRVSRHSLEAALFYCDARRCVPRCKRANVMLTTNAFLTLVLYHGSIGSLASYQTGGTRIILFSKHALPSSISRGLHGVRDAATDRIQVACPPVNFE